VRTRTVGSDVQTFDHVGVSDVLWRQAGTTTSSGLIDADGSRVGTRTGSTGSWLLFDLLGSLVAAEGTSGTSITDALRYDAWGQTLGLYPSGGSALTTRFRGLVDIAPTADPDVTGAGSDPLYVMGARSYSPHTGSFISLDSYAGQARDPASLHRYLYAHANPTTLIDPTGHGVDCQIGQACDPEDRADDQQRWRDHEEQKRKEKSDGGAPPSGDGNDTTTSTNVQTTSGGNPPPVPRRLAARTSDLDPGLASAADERRRRAALRTRL
jgi:RHS repeat-associated protein